MRTDDNGAVVALYALRPGERSYTDKPAPVGTSRRVELGAPVVPKSSK
jgi:hypothetical protein